MVEIYKIERARVFVGFTLCVDVVEADRARVHDQVRQSSGQLHRLLLPETKQQGIHSVGFVVWLVVRLTSYINVKLPTEMDM